MMEDFNRDNAKIDAALKAEETARVAAMNTVNNRLTAEKNALDNRITSEKTALESAVAQRLHFVQGPTIRQTVNATSKFSVALPDLHLEKYYFAILTLVFPQVTGTWYSTTNNEPDGHCGIEAISGQSGLVYAISNSTRNVLLFPMKTSDWPAVGISLGGGMEMCSMGARAGAFNSIQFYPSGGSGTFNGDLVISIKGIQ